MEHFDVSVNEGVVVLRPVVVSLPTERLKAVRAKLKALGLTEKDTSVTRYAPKTQRPSEDQSPQRATSSSWVIF